MCSLQSTNAYYKAISKTQIGTKTIEIHKNKTLYRQNNKSQEKKQCTRSTGKKTLNPEKK